MNEGESTSSSAAGAPQVKGYALLSYFAPLRRDPKRWPEVSPFLSEPTARRLEYEVYANQWYPRQLLDELLDAFSKAYPRDHRVFRELGARAAREQINGVYRLFLTFATPAMVFRRAESLWTRQSSSGHFRVLSDAGEQLVGELVDRELHPAMPEVVAGWSDEVIGMLRRTPIPTEITTPAPGTYHFLVRWTK